jgi:hypothetical protein
MLKLKNKKHMKKENVKNSPKKKKNLRMLNLYADIVKLTSSNLITIIVKNTKKKYFT